MNVRDEIARALQSWPCPLDEAPKIGDAYRILHDEWVYVPETEQYDRRIHKYEIVTPEEA